MNGMSTQQRLEDIAKRSGLSVEVCRRVLSAETASITESLKRGERSTLIGRVTLKPEIRKKLKRNDTGEAIIDSIIHVKPSVSPSLKASLENEKGFSVDIKDEGEGIRLKQIEALN